jgi:WD40 repeat protein
MASNEEPFTQEDVDQEIEQLSQRKDANQMTKLPDARLINDLVRAHRAESSADAQSLSDVFVRLHERERNELKKADVPENVLLFSSPRQESKGLRAMNTTTPGSGAKIKLFSRSRMIVIAASLVAAILLASTLYTLNSFHTLKTNQLTIRPGTTLSSSSAQELSSAKLACSITYKDALNMFADSSVDWSAQGVIATTDPAPRTFSAQNCAQLPIVNKPTSNIGTTWSPDGKRLLLSGGNGAQIVDGSTGSTLVKLNEPDSSFQFSRSVWTPNGTQIVSADEDILTHSTESVDVHIWNASTGALVRTALTFNNNVLIDSSLISPDGQYLAVQKPNKSIEIWDIASGKLMKTIAAGQQALLPMAWSPDGASLAVSLWNASTQYSGVQVWSVKSATPVVTFQDKGNNTGDGVMGLAWSPDGKYLVESSNAIHVWDVAAGKLVTTFGKVTNILAKEGKSATTSMIMAVGWAPNSDSLASITTSLSSRPSGGQMDVSHTLNVWKLS